jgi:hypothetical protein
MPSATSSLPMRSSDPRRVLLIRCPSIRLGEKQRPMLVYLAGALVSRRSVLTLETRWPGCPASDLQAPRELW